MFHEAPGKAAEAQDGGGARVIVPAKVALLVAVGAVALGFMMALALSPAVEGDESNVVLVASNNIVVTIETVENSK